MTATVAPRTEAAWHRRDASIADVLAAMSDIRRKFAREEAGDDDAHPHPRSCVMTLIAVATTDAEEQRAQDIARRIAAQHPAQAIVVREQHALRGSQVEAWIHTDVQRPQEACAVQCELVTLHVRGAAGEHLAAIVDPMLVSGVPTYLWWVGTPAFGKRELEDALHVCDALIVDSARFDEPAHGFHGLARLTTSAHRQLGVADFQWSRLRTWREMTAQFFSPLERREFLSGISQIAIDYAGDGRGNLVAAGLLTGWLSSSLGWKLRHASSGGGGSASLNFSALRGHPVEVRLRSVDRAGPVEGELCAVRVAGAAQRTTFRLEVELNPPRRRAPEGSSYQALHPVGAHDDAGFELASRRAEQHRGVLHSRLHTLHHTASGDAPGESRPRHPMVHSEDRRRPEKTAQLLLTVIQIGEGQTLRQVQQLEPPDEAELLLDLLAGGTRDAVFQRSLEAANALMRAL